MSRKPTSKRTRPKPKAVLRLPDLDQAKSAVLNSLTSAVSALVSPESQPLRLYRPKSRFLRQDFPRARLDPRSRDLRRNNPERVR